MSTWRSCQDKSVAASWIMCNIVDTVKTEQNSLSVVKEIEPNSTNVISDDKSNDNDLLFESDEISSDEQLSQIIATINQTSDDRTTTPVSEVSDIIDNIVAVEQKPEKTRNIQTPIGAKLAKKLETFANKKLTADDNKPNSANGKTVTVATTTASSAIPTTNPCEAETKRRIEKAAKNIMKNLPDLDPQKNLMSLCIKLAEFQEQYRVACAKVNELEKRSTVIMRERDQTLLENGRITAAKAKLESLCRELHRHNQQIRDESMQRQRDDEGKRKELATKFQTTIDEIAAQLSNYSEKSSSLREQNVQLSEQLAVVVKDYDLREKEVEAALKQKELELRLTEASLEQMRLLLTERTELIKQERQVSEAERLVLFKKCEELAGSELGLRQQVTIYSERYQEFQNAITQSSQMVTSCHTEIEKMGKKIKKLEKERADFQHRWQIAEQNQKKSADETKQIEKEKRQLETKMDKLEKLSRALQQERGELQNTIKTLTKASSSSPITTSIGINNGNTDGSDRHVQDESKQTAGLSTSESSLPSQPTVAKTTAATNDSNETNVIANSNDNSSSFTSIVHEENGGTESPASVEQLSTSEPIIHQLSSDIADSPNLYNGEYSEYPLSLI
ncbi:unnamed protein product [Didymodactylos carnosus]|uniref:Alpha-taxilin n=1 Tax=Didymodactylos carnosus TaxID=1234261 RepID=A0A813ZFD0_9BILA|nr:unnamed protein product [Didymodactylos carnosus]CAF0898302.1 unnamed protein product [Didymodactylos carnosus]CAF3501226.1 unnamed protein product [Didymodactylos carnosus]CAF3681200.1 unnamed protein product [Didymodactylos carnosus]